MLRIHFDPARPEPVHSAARPDAMWEVLLSLHALQDPFADPGLDRWRARVRRDLTAPMRRLAALAPPEGYSPDFLTPLGAGTGRPAGAEGPGGLDAGLAALRATPADRFRRDLRLLARQDDPERGAAARALLREGPGALAPLAEAVRAYFALALAAEWDARTALIADNLAADPDFPAPAPPPGSASRAVPAPRSAPRTAVRAGARAGRVRPAGRVPVGRAAGPGDPAGAADAAGAAEATAAGVPGRPGGGAVPLPAPLRRAARWQGAVLELPYPLHRDLRLGGRPLHLVPSYFCRRYPIALRDPLQAAVVVYPAVHTASAPPRAALEPQRRAALERLLGRTRAAVFEALAEGCTTTELSRRLEISPASASEHTTVLRGSGLVASHRERNTVCHRVTELGFRLLHGHR
ncbi:winged helix-turn-helix domain-containing protein [Streptomonospora sp. S1-112]|uniref:Winged helix-turn-helix domain-containing protein n=1 Tax=Streptomonospora mangrovi TaxID=2883123 RepID=A0A9X3SH40_9ACTN|nr:winged helix-turn-helix domain-containing protein [Streptomonospora mangrovi]MDA0567537.1 winged helix-turn-helix domain-containing protein [Streptomonospora mangrovi]